MLRLRLFVLMTLFMLPLIPAVTVTAQDAPAIDPANFVEAVDNPYFPLVPGTTFIYEGDSDGTMEHIEVHVTHATREVMGVMCVVVRDRVWEDGELVEDTFDWYAQDADGSVWYFGEDSSEIEDGEVVSKAGSWEAGVDGAQAGIIMGANPEVGSVYRQEFYEGEAEDMAEVIALDESETVAYGAFDDLLVTKEWTPLEPGIAENKYYAEGLGLVLEVVVEGGEGRVELIDVIADDDDSTENNMQGDTNETGEG